PRPPPALGTHHRGDAGSASRRAVSGDGHFLPPGSRSGRWAGGLAPPHTALHCDCRARAERRRGPILAGAGGRRRGRWRRSVAGQFLYLRRPGGARLCRRLRPCRRRIAVPAFPPPRAGLNPACAIGRTSRRTAMPVIDVQVHPFDRNHPGRPWASRSHGLGSATGEEMVAAMNSVGVDGAIMVSSFSAYEYDPSYALEVYNTYPDKFRVVTPVAATNPAIDDVVAKWAATPGARGIRIRMRDGLPMDADHPGLHRAFAAAAKHGLPVNLL